MRPRTIVVTAREEVEIENRRQLRQGDKVRFDRVRNERRERYLAEREARRKDLFHQNGRPKKRLIRIFPSTGGEEIKARRADNIKDFPDRATHIADIAREEGLVGDFIAVITDPCAKQLLSTAVFTAAPKPVPAVEISIRHQ